MTRLEKMGDSDLLRTCRIVESKHENIQTQIDTNSLAIPLMGWIYQVRVASGKRQDPDSDTVRIGI
jgi:hypothetical protein